MRPDNPYCGDCSRYHAAGLCSAVGGSPKSINERIFWILWSPEGTTPPRVTFDTREAALAQAEAMARQHRGNRFFVMEAKSLSMVDGVKTTVLG